MVSPRILFCFEENATFHVGCTPDEQRLVIGTCNLDKQFVRECACVQRPKVLPVISSTALAVAREQQDHRKSTP